MPKKNISDADTAPQKIIVYARVSTDKQETAQQMRTVAAWLTAHNMEATEVVEDEGVSGGVGYRSRKLGQVVVPALGRGDVLIVAELSRLGRSMVDVADLIEHDLKPRGVRLVVVSAGIDVECDQMKSAGQFQIQAIAFAAQLEKELIQERTRSAIEVRKRRLADDGSFVSKAGRVCRRLGNPTQEGLSRASAASAALRRAKAKADPNNKAIWAVLAPLSVNGAPPTTEALKSAVVTFAERDIRTATGKTLNVARARSCYHSLKPIFS